MAVVQTLTQDEKDNLNEAIKKIWKFIEQMESYGVKMPGLVKKVQVLEKAVQTGEDVDEACRETQESLDQYTDNLWKACENSADGDEGEEWACKAACWCCRR